MSGKTVLSMAVAATALAGVAHGAVVPVVAVFGHNEKDNFTGNIVDTINGSGMNGNGDTGSVTWPTGAGDPSTWTLTSPYPTTYRAEWQSAALLSGASNSKIGWIVFDLGTTVTNLDKLYLWNEREDQPRTIEDYNVYYATSPTVAVTHGPTNTTALDYDFASGGWTQVGSTLTMSWRGTTGEATTVNDIVALGDISARYLAIEILSNGIGVTGNTTKVGLAEVGVSVVPEPTSLTLLGLGGLGLLRRRRVA